MSRKLLLGVVIAAQGLKGEVKVKTFTSAPQALSDYGALETQTGARLHVTQLRPHKGDVVIVRFAEVSDRDAAEALKGAELLVSRSALPDAVAEEFYHADLVGLSVQDELDRTLGRVGAIHNFGAGDVIEILRDDGDTVLLPFTRAFVPNIDLAGGRIVVAVPDEVEASGQDKGNVE